MCIYIIYICIYYKLYIIYYVINIWVSCQTLDALSDFLKIFIYEAQNTPTIIIYKQTYTQLIQRA